MRKRIWVLGASSDEMFHVENLLTEAGEPFVYALIFLPDSGLTARVSEENAHSIVWAKAGFAPAGSTRRSPSREGLGTRLLVPMTIEAFAYVGTPVPRRVYFVECAARLNSTEEPPISIFFSGSDIVRQVADELARLGRGNAKMVCQSRRSQ
jgi:hypothetical protein